MIIVLINWRILPSKVGLFLKRWKMGLSLSNPEGFIGEFLSKVGNVTFFEGITWEMEADERDEKSLWRDENYVSYVNVGLWESTEGFTNAVGEYMSAGRTMKEDFEAAPRRRAILTPQHWRRGSPGLPDDASEGVTP